MSKGRLPAILLNADFYSKGRNIRWMKDNGYEAIPILQAVWIASSQEKDCKILKEDAYSIPFLLTFNSEKIKKILDSAVEVGLLDGNETHYWNSQIAKDAKKFQSKHNNYSKASKERERAKQEQDSGRILPELRQNHIDNDNVIDNELEILIEEFQEPKITEAIRRWISYRIGINKPLNQESLNSLIRLYDGKAEEIPGDIDHTISSGWKNLQCKPREHSRASPKQSAAERNLEATKEALRQIKEEIES